MAQTPEGVVKRKTRGILDSFNVYYFFPPANGYGQSGRFDVCCSYFGHFMGIETKADASKTPTALQTKNARACWKSGASVLLLHIDNLDVLRSLLEDIKTNEGKGFNRILVWKVDGTWISRAKK